MIDPQRRSSALLDAAAVLAVVSLALEFGFREPIGHVWFLRVLQALAYVAHWADRARPYFVSADVRLEEDDSSADRLHPVYARRDGVRHAVRDNAIESALLIVGAVGSAVAFDFILPLTLRTGAIYVALLRLFRYVHRYWQGVLLQLRSSPAGWPLIKTAFTAYGAVILIGAAFLALPRAMTEEHRTDHPRYVARHMFNALFTATSATTLTGLAVNETGKDYTRFGQYVILALMQLGGWLTLFFFGLLAVEMGLWPSLGMTLNEDRTAHDADAVPRLIGKIILVVSLSIETVGAVVLYVSQWMEFGSSSASFFNCLFNSVSAYCHVGLTLGGEGWGPDSWNMGMYGALVVLMVLGGLGLPVIHECAIGFTRPSSQRSSALSGSTRAILILTLVLILVPAAWIHTTGALGSDEAVSPCGWATSLILMISSRSVGFPTISLDVESVPLSVHAVLAILILLGAAPGSTGGGINIMVLLVVVVAVYRAIRKSGRLEVGLFVDWNTRASLRIALVMTGLATLGTALLMLTDQAATFREAAFETVSAVGSSGLSMGLTPRSTHTGKAVLLILMVMGRWGPLLALGGLASNRPGRPAGTLGFGYNAAKGTIEPEGES